MVKQEQLYLMVNLQRKTEDKTLIQTAWIPEQFVIKDKMLGIDTYDEKGVKNGREEGWQVMDERCPTDVARPLSHFTSQRRAAGQLV